VKSAEIIHMLTAQVRRDGLLVYDPTKKNASWW
jgi:hypothetical protein